MRKMIYFLVLFLFITTSNALPVVERQTGKSPIHRWGMVMKRGVVNLVTIPAEIPVTFMRETDIHSWLWPITGIPRWIYNFAVRVASTANDVSFFPWVSLFTDDIRPWTEPMGLPEYPWQME